MRERDRERKKKKTIIFVDDQVCNMVGSRSEVIGEEGGEEWVKRVGGQIEQQRLSIIYKKKQQREREKKTRDRPMINATMLD